MGDRVQEILSWYGSDNAGTKSNIAAHAAVRQIGRDREVGHFAGGPGIRAWSGAEFCAEPVRLRSTLSLSTRDRCRCNAHAAPLRFLEAGASHFAGQIPIKTLVERVKHVVQSSFDGRRIVIFSGGAKGEDNNVFEEARAIRDGGGFGSIIGRNSF
ncbi:MAG TPA: hypothetical protein VF078_03370, partial [Nitrospira sp.]